MYNSYIYPLVSYSCSLLSTFSAIFRLSLPSRHCYKPSPSPCAPLASFFMRSAAIVCIFIKHSTRFQGHFVFLSIWPEHDKPSVSAKQTLPPKKGSLSTVDSNMVDRILTHPSLSSSCCLWQIGVLPVFFPKMTSLDAYLCVVVWLCTLTRMFASKTIGGSLAFSAFLPLFPLSSSLHCSQSALVADRAPIPWLPIPHDVMNRYAKTGGIRIPVLVSQCPPRDQSTWSSRSAKRM